MVLSFLAETALTVTRRKETSGNVLETRLRRCLSTVDVAFFGIGNMLGSGIYILAPTAANQIAGPAIVLSFLLAGFASLLAALAYAEFGVRFPLAGSAYSYTYFSLGELLAFFVGWNLMMENVLSLAVVGRTCSAYANSLSNGAIENFTIRTFGKFHDSKDSYWANYPDVLAAVILTAFLLFMLLGAKETSCLNNLLVVMNIAVMLTLLLVGAIHSDLSNWEYRPERGDPKHEGFISGFLPYGWSGVFAACAQCFFAYVGFDGIAAAGEEARNPRKTIPLATMITMAVVSTVYVSISGVLTLMLPYYKIDPESGIPEALRYHKAYWAEYIVSAGAIASMVTVIMGTIFAVSRIMYAMAEDGLLPSVFHFTFRQVPFFAMVVCTVLGSVMAIIFDINTIIEMLSIGTLFAYFIVAYGILVVRHSPPNTFPEEPAPQIQLRSRVPDFLYNVYPSNMAQKTLVVTILFFVTCFSLGLGFSINTSTLDFNKRVVVCLLCAFMILLSCLYITPLEELLKDDSYRVPFAPFLGILSMSLNAFLMTTLETVTWYRFLAWLLFGLVIYFAHGIRHSKLNDKKQESELETTTAEE